MQKRPSIGLALSGSGRNSAFYIGFLEVFQEHNIQIDYLAACSGACIVAAAYACGTLPELKTFSNTFTRDTLFRLLSRKSTKGGIYNLDLMEDELRLFTKNLRFEDVKPLMGFAAVDIESGEQVVLSMGDIAHAARISCTLPGLFNPIKWGGRTLIDGGLLSKVPVDVLKQVGMDVAIGINLRGSPHIFRNSVMTFKKITDSFKKILYIDQLGKIVENFMGKEEMEYEVANNQGIFTVLGKSLDIAIKASKKDYSEILACDLMITPNIPSLKVKDLAEASSIYMLGRQTALENIESIKKLIHEKTEVKV